MVKTNIVQLMQRQKANIREEILMTAGKIFAEQGFQRTSMRDIAKASGVGLSNIYNYFRNKDKIFCELLRPLTDELYRIIYRHKVDEMTIDVFTDRSYLQQEVEEYFELTQHYQRELQLLLFQAQGSSLATFREKYTDEMTRTILVFFRDLKQEYPELNVDVSPFFIHLNTSWLFTLLEELVMHHIRREDMKRVIAEYLTFETAGWKELMHA